jgi:hypothetical protein
MESESPFLAICRTEQQIKTVLRGVDIALLSLDEKGVISSIRRLATDTRLDIRDYELSETREEQLKSAMRSGKRLAKLRAAIVAASLAFGPVDVAQLTAQLEQIESWLH